MMKPSFTSTAFLVALVASVTAAAQQKPPAPVPTPPRGPVAQGADVALAREIQGAGLSTCQPISDQVVKYMVDKSRSSGLLFVAPQEANYRVFSTSIAIESTSVTTYASASFAPYGNVGCGAALDLVTYFTDSCSVVSAFFQKQLQAANGAICTLSLSFNNDGPLGTFFRYIGDTATYLARYDDLFTGKEEQIDVSKVDVSMNGIELQDREFFAAIREGREPNASVAQVLPCYQVLHQLEQQLA